MPFDAMFSRQITAKLVALAAALVLGVSSCNESISAADSLSENEQQLQQAGIDPTQDGVRTYLESILKPDLGKEVDRLISQLSDLRFRVREAATRSLLKMELLPLEKMEAAAKSSDPEQALRAKMILKALSASKATPLRAALQLVEAKKFDVGLPLLLKILEGAKSDATREAAVRAMSAIVREADRPLAVEMLKRPHVATRNAARRMLARLDATAPLLEGNFFAVQITPGNVSGGGPNLIAGWEFKTKSKLIVTHLGIYDAGKNGLNFPHEVAIWDVENRNAPVAIQKIPQGRAAPLAGVFRFLPVERAELEAGRRYAVVAHYPDPSDSSVSLINPSGLTVNFADHFEVIGRRYTFPHKQMAFPVHLQPGGVKHATLGPSFRFEAVPQEPAQN